MSGLQQTSEYNTYFIQHMFGINLNPKKKTGIEALKEKLEEANKHLIEAQKVMNEFYKLLFEIEPKGVEKNGSDKIMEEL